MNEIPRKEHMRLKPLGVALLFSLALWFLFFWGIGVVHASPGGPGGPPITVTNTPKAQMDLALAQAYWQLEVPGPPIEPSCLPIIVTVEALTPLDKENQLGSCELILSPQIWITPYAACADITHEYGRSLGLADMDNNTILNANPAKQGRQQPLCALVYTPKHLTKYEKNWLKKFS